MILNSKSEYNRCKIPRLVIEELDEEQLKADEERELQEAIEWLNKCEEEWQESKTAKREQELRAARSKLSRLEGRVASKKREQEQNKDDKGANKKRRIKHEVISEDWGEQTQVGDTKPPGSSEANKEPPTLVS